MADLLAANAAPSTIRKQLRDTGSEVDVDLVGRLNALDFVDSVVGGVADMPEHLGDFRVVGLLGRGGMGTVFEAYQESLDRYVALKVLSPMFSTDVKMRKRFRSEAKATAALHHQHIVPIYGYGEAAGVLYFAMEKVEGVSLDKHIAAARHRGVPAMEPEEAARKFAGVADALAHAHRRRLLHRDVKPGNLLVNPDGTLSLADFGLSKVLGEASMNVTQGGAFLGTLHYAPPEQAKGQTLTPASDLYSLGVTMFETLTGELPLKADSTQAMLHELLHGSPRRLRSLAPRVPKDLAAVVDKLLQKIPEDRYTDGEELARDLMRVAEGEPVRIRRQPLVMRIWRRIKRNPGQAAAIALVTGLVGVTAYQTVRNMRVERKSNAAQAENKVAEFMAGAMWDVGEAYGPGRLFEVLTGRNKSSGTAERSELLATLDEAAKLVPDVDLGTSDLRQAYLSNPHPDASAFLSDGKGYAALQSLNVKIAETRRGMRLDTETNESWLKLYRLYLARAVAQLTAAVGKPDLARLDLVRASMVRPGAFFPQVLQAFLDWRPTDNVSALTAKLDELIATGPEGANRVVAGVCQTFAGLRRSWTAHMMSFDLRYGQRRRLQDYARSQLRYISELPGARSGMDAGISALAEGALQLRGEPELMRQSIGWARSKLEDAAPDAPVQSWALVLDVLEFGTCERDLPVDRRVRGWIDLLRLEPDLEYARSLAPDIRKLVAGHPDARGVRELAARLEERTGQWGEAIRWAELWYEEDTANPDPLVCRFSAEVHAGKVDDAAFTMALALQKTHAPGIVRKELDAALRSEQRRAGPAAEHWTRLRSALRAAPR